MNAFFKVYVNFMHIIFDFFLVFNAGEYRRKIYGTVNCKHDFFSSNNPIGHEARMYDRFYQAFLFIVTAEIAQQYVKFP